MTQIVTLNVSQQVAPIPSDLQRKGAIISEGGTSLAVGSTKSLTSPDDLASILAVALPLSNASASPNGSNDTTLLTYGEPHGISVGSKSYVAISNASDDRYNGNYSVTSISPNQVTYSPKGGYPGTSIGNAATASNEDVQELVGTVQTFFEQGKSISVDILELGLFTNFDDATEDLTIAELSTFLTQNPNAYYCYLVPKSWADRTNFHVLHRQFNGLQDKTYFFCTARLDNYGYFTNTDKSCFVLLEAPTAPASEHTIASAFYAALCRRLTATSKLTPFNYTYVYGVTAYPTIGNAGLLALLKASNVNVVSIGSEGGITNTMLTYGRMMDGRPFNYWYAVDWACINVQRNLSNEIINGSNDSINPLYYNQTGINRLEARFAATMNSGVSFGCVLGLPVQLSFNGDDLDAALDANAYPGKTVINAIPFIDYGTANPGDYRIGVYGGLSASFVPQAGFDAILVNMVVSDFAAQ